MSDTDKTIETPPSTILDKAAPEPVVYAGKFKGEEELGKGIANLSKMMNVQMPEKIIGEGGAFTDAKTAEAFYTSLESLKSKIPAKEEKAAEAPKPDEKAKDDKPLAIADKPAEAEARLADTLTKGGIDVAAVEKKFLETGKLDTADYDKIKAIEKFKGWTNTEINEFASAMAARSTVQSTAQADFKAKAASIVGGMEQLNVLLNDEAPKLFTAAEIADLNKDLNDPSRMDRTLHYMKSKHAEAVGAGKSKPLIAGTPSIGSPALKTLAEKEAASKRAALGDKSAIAQLAQSQREETLAQRILG